MIKEIDYYKIENLKVWDNTQGFLNQTQRKINEIIDRQKFIESKINQIIKTLNEK